MRAHLNRLPKYKKEKVLNAKDTDGFTAVHYAAKFNRFKILQLLVTFGASESSLETTTFLVCVLASSVCCPSSTKETLG